MSVSLRRLSWVIESTADGADYSISEVFGAK
jgi:hypothetical protein